MRNLFFSLVLMCLLGSCASHQGTLSSSSVSVPVKYEDIALGTAETDRYFGFGGLSQDALVLEAKGELVRNRPLKTNEQYINFTTDFKISYHLFHRQTKVTISADVVSLQKDSIYNPYSDIYKRKLFSKAKSHDLFHIGDSVYEEQGKKGTILNIHQNEIIFLCDTKANEFKTQKKAMHHIYAVSKPYNGLTVGNACVFAVNIAGKGEKRKGKIIALGLTKVMVKDLNGVLFVVNYKNIFDK